MQSQEGTLAARFMHPVETDVLVMSLLLMSSSGPVHHLLPSLQNDLGRCKPIGRTPRNHDH